MQYMQFLEEKSEWVIFVLCDISIYFCSVHCTAAVTDMQLWNASIVYVDSY